MEVARANLSQFVGLEPSAQIAVSAPRLLQLPPEPAVAPLDTAENPVAVEQNAVVEQLRAQLQSLERSLFSAILRCKARPMRAAPAPN